MPRPQRSGRTLSGPKNPMLPQFAAKLEPTTWPSSSAAIAALGSINQRVRTRSASPERFIPRKVANAVAQTSDAVGRSSSRSGRISRLPTAVGFTASPAYPSSLGQEAKGFALLAPHCREVSAIERHDQIGVQPLGEGYHRRIDPTEGEVGVAVDELSDPCPIIALRATNIDADERFEEASLYARSKPGSDKITRFG